MTFDRTYYRQLADSELVEHVGRSTSPTELEIVLAEKLEQASDTVNNGLAKMEAELERELEQAEERIKELKTEICSLEAELDER